MSNYRYVLLMTPRREIKVNPAFLSASSRKGKQKGPPKNHRVRKSSTQAMRHKLLKRINDHRKDTNHSRQNTSVDERTELEESLAYLENLSKSKKTRRKKGRVEPSSTGEATRSAPKFGCLKGGILPTFKEWSKKAEVGEREAALAKIRNQRGSPPKPELPGPLTQDKLPPVTPKPEVTKPATEKVPNTVLAKPATDPVSSSTNVTPEPKSDTVTPHTSSVSAPRPRATKTHRVCFGKSTKNRTIKVRLVNREDREMVEADRAAAQQASIGAVCKHLRCKGLLKGSGGDAPEPLLRATYINSLLGGDLQNTGKGAALENFKHSTVSAEAV